MQHIAVVVRCERVSFMWASLPSTSIIVLVGCVLLLQVLVLASLLEVISSSELLLSTSIRRGYNTNSSRSGSSEKRNECDHHDIHTTKYYYELNMTLCDGKCKGSCCKTYMTPLHQCYSSERLFPNDPSWSGKDVFDTVTCHQQTLTRTIFQASTDGSCQVSDQDDDQFRIPLNECVGPFGPPRPWGTFQLLTTRSIDRSIDRLSLSLRKEGRDSCCSGL
jgi:hypothetical protein